MTALSRPSEPKARPVWPYEALNARGRTLTPGVRPGKTQEGLLRTDNRSGVADCQLETAGEVNSRA
jgi:hypothetical protein